MPSNVLVPFDGAVQSESALEYAIAAFPEASLTALYVVDVLGDPDVDADPLDVQRDDLERRGRAVLERATELASDAGVEIRTELRIGVPHRDVLEYVVEAEADHVVVGGHGRSPVSHPFLGAVSEAIVRRSPVSTTVVPMDRSEFETVDVDGTVLVPVDGSAQATAALEFAVEQFPTADVTAVHVVGLPFEYSATELEGSAFERLLSGLTDRGETVLESTLEAADVDDAEIDTALAYGKPPQSIVDYALDYAFDQVVMGIHGRPKTTRLFTGSVAETVARRAGFPITLVRGRADDVR